MPQLQPQTAPEPLNLLPLTTGRYHRMLEKGILEGGATEGDIALKLPQGALPLAVSLLLP